MLRAVVNGVPKSVRLTTGCGFGVGVVVGVAVRLGAGLAQPPVMWRTPIMIRDRISNPIPDPMIMSGSAESGLFIIVINTSSAVSFSETGVSSSVMPVVVSSVTSVAGSGVVTGDGESFAAEVAVLVESVFSMISDGAPPFGVE